jgi:hypothetical protein
MKLNEPCKTGKEKRLRAGLPEANRTSTASNAETIGFSECEHGGGANDARRWAGRHLRVMGAPAKSEYQPSAPVILQGTGGTR